jgi:hypothetical protein
MALGMDRHTDGTEFSLTPRPHLYAYNPARWSVACVPIHDRPISSVGGHA